MKKILFASIILTVICNNLYAQNISIRGGFNLSNMLDKNDFITTSDDYQARPGFHFGGIIDFPLSSNISLETGILFTTKGYKYDRVFPAPSGSDELIIDGGPEGAEQETEAKIRTNLSYIDIPLAGKVMYDLNGVKIYGLLGPYLGYGISGQQSGEEIVNGVTINEVTLEVSWGEAVGFKRFDYGLYMGAGVEINKFQIGINYSLGLANIHVNPENDINPVQRNRVLGLISIGYRIADL